MKCESIAMPMPAGFDRLPVVAVWEPGEWVLCCDVTYTSLDGVRYVIPAGFVTDFASIPRPAQALYAIDDETRCPALLHDWLYCLQLTTRAEADALFLEALGRAGVRWSKRRLMHGAVRVGGWRYWSAHGGELRQDDFVTPDVMGFLIRCHPLHPLHTNQPVD